ncbi:hypothetical protein [Nonomuraea jabiensis]|uniref:Uncharacterized protein n=1 Tax=Nonomuraea jabiensis TaxID=882448 RepID=A0A7W9LA36_9ACTN|nr:hypothetical protein [Nonomuraea jabiensis]MBB5776234.1 hypothetical protein [Nonomuraea jabiensis]
MSQAEWDVTHLDPVTGTPSWDEQAIHRSGAGAEREPAPDPEAVHAQALFREREGYVRRGLADRVAAVDAELTRLGHPGPAGQQVTAKPARKSRARKVTDGVA